MPAWLHVGLALRSLFNSRNSVLSPHGHRHLKPSTESKDANSSLVSRQTATLDVKSALPSAGHHFWNSLCAKRGRFNSTLQFKKSPDLSKLVPWRWVCGREAVEVGLGQPTSVKTKQSFFEQCALSVQVTMQPRPPTQPSINPPATAKASAPDSSALLITHVRHFASLFSLVLPCPILSRPIPRHPALTGLSSEEPTDSSINQSAGMSRSLTKCIFSVA
ncbi:hypothetical protein BKA81DRAFT_417461 [Phyllosticta paracitricarpa]|uniref:Uncharacterized protein n=1 Tax=Phyllosticta citricarpa TaxID=55181 RepID=A0ABR1M6C5_9PEZI